MIVVSENMLIKYLLSKLVKNYNNSCDSSRVESPLLSFAVGLVCGLVSRYLGLTLPFVLYIFLNTFHFSRKAWKNSAQPPRVRLVFVFELYPFASGGWLLHKYAVDACVVLFVVVTIIATATTTATTTAHVIVIVVLVIIAAARADSAAPSVSHPMRL